MTALSKRPDDEHLAIELGRVKKLWDAFLEHVQSQDVPAKIEWKHYSTGWRLVVKARGRNIAYLNPGSRRFTASFALSDENLDAAESAGLSTDFVKSIRESKKFPEGRAARIEVTSTTHLAQALALLAGKMAR